MQNTNVSNQSANISPFLFQNQASNQQQPPPSGLLPQPPSSGPFGNQIQPQQQQFIQQQAPFLPTSHNIFGSSNINSNASYGIYNAQVNFGSFSNVQQPQQQSLYAQVPPSYFSFQTQNPFQGQSETLQIQSFADDELISQSTVAKQIKPTETLNESKINLTLASQFQKIRIGDSINIPSLCSLTGVGGARASVDIICLIDQSGSMSGEKIQLVRDTMKYVLKMLTPKDRLSIAVYENQGRRVCPFKFVNKDNEASLENIINQLRAGGGNIMINGLQVAIKMLRERRSRNEVTSIFLLSDGQEPHNTGEMFKQMLARKVNENIGSFSLHSFGFGNDHDQNLMTKICSIKDGNFYFINKLSTLDEAFCNALGGIITQTATDIEINVECIAPAPLQGITISKVYGNKWNKITDQKYSISINQIMSEVSKDFVFELSIPKTSFQALDALRSIQVLSATYSAIDTITKKKLQGKTTLKLEFLDQSAAYKRESNPIVVEPYYRLLAVQTINSSIKLAEQGNFDQARKQIDDILQTIKYHPSIRKENIKGLIQDLELAKQKCTKQVFHSEGRKEMVNLCYANTNNCSYQFSNQCQQQMLFDLKQQKKY